MKFLFNFWTKYIIPDTNTLHSELDRILDSFYPEDKIVCEYNKKNGGKSGEGYVVYSMFSGNMYFNDMEYVKQHLTICGIKFKISLYQSQSNPISIEDRTISQEYISFRYLSKTKDMNYVYSTGECNNCTVSLTIWKS